MGINPSVIAAAIINFFIFFLIIKKFIYKPTMAMVDGRRDEVETALNHAKSEEAKIESLRIEQEERIKEYKDEGQKLVDAYKEKAERVSVDIIAEAKKECDVLRSRTKQEIAREKRKAEDEMKTQVVDLSLNLAEKALEKKIDEDEHRRLIDEFISKVGN
ncbi:F0F1 ATP synthase subunit B [Clostridium sp. ATCC 25772]|uniref:F0F1 ATP synthase subunit B n=1 Tax=Clostridium sp. ATCC 25772 TaxID=1676991 RepID=UPI000781F867|nr:F0F1 ATP synthase subunit B [Clostridium sp. ATCC 25772]